MSVFLLQQLLTQSAEQYPDNIAIIHGDQRIDYATLNKRSDQLANALIQLGVQNNDRVGLFLPHSIDGVIALFGILKAGAGYVPIDPQSPFERTRHIIVNCSLKVIFSCGDLAGKLLLQMGRDTTLSNVLLSDEATDLAKGNPAQVTVHSCKSLYQNESSVPQTDPVSDSEPAYILHTSGSTGIPKGVSISHHGALSFVNMAAERFNICSSDRVSSLAPLHFDLSVFDIFTTLCCGATVVMVPKQLAIFPKILAKYISDNKISVWNSVSSIISILAENGHLDEFDFSDMRLVHFSGEILPTRHLRIAMAAMTSASFFNIYGQTEANSTMCYPIRDIPDDLGWKAPIGNAMPGCEVFALVDDDRQISNAGEEGELHIRSNTMALGYWNDDRLTSEKFVSDPRKNADPGRVYRTGDIVKLNENREYELVGRKDNLIKSRGYRIDLGEIESILYNCESVEAAVALPIPNELVGNEIVVFIVVKDTTCSSDFLFGHCKQHLPPYMIPKSIDILEKMPYTATGKIDRKRLRNRLTLKNSVTS